MKTSVMEVHDMLSVLSVDGVEKHIGEVAGVESVTVNFAAGNATVRYDETRLDIADIRSSVRQNGYETGESEAAKASGNHANQNAPGKPPETAAPVDLPAKADAAGATAAQPADATPSVKPTASKPTPISASSPSPDAAKPLAEKPDNPPMGAEHQHSAPEEKN